MTILPEIHKPRHLRSNATILRAFPSVAVSQDDSRVFCGRCGQRPSRCSCSRDGARPPIGKVIALFPRPDGNPPGGAAMAA